MATRLARQASFDELTSRVTELLNATAEARDRMLELREEAWVIRLPRRLHDRYLSVQRARDDLAQELGRSPTIAELAERVGSSPEEILETLEASDARGVRSIDTPPPGSEDRDLSEVLGTVDD